MATQNKIIEMIASIKTIYSYYAKDTDVQILVKTWTALLKDYSDEMVETAFYKCLQTCKMPPTPADVIEQLKALFEANEQTDEQLWNEYIKTLRKVERQCSYIQYPRFGETAESERKKVTEIWEALPDRLKTFIGAEGELIRMARTYTDDELKFEKTRFLKTMPTIKKRSEYKALAEKEQLKLKE